MCSPVRVATRRAKRHSFHRLRLAALPALALLAGCSAASAPVVGPDPSDPNARVRAVGYRSTLGSYVSQRPVAPAPWGEQNQRVAPKPSE